MNVAIVYGILAAASFGIAHILFTVTARNLGSLTGAVVIPLASALVGIPLLMMNAKIEWSAVSRIGILYAALTGVFGFGLDYFAMRAYGEGLEISIGGPIIIGGSIALAAAFGLFTGEAFPILKIVGIGLVIAGGTILASLSRT